MPDQAHSKAGPRRLLLGRVGRIGSAAVIAGIAVTVFLSVVGDSGDGRLVDRAQAAIETPRGQIEHVKLREGALLYEYWTLGDRGSRTILTLPDGSERTYLGGPICSILASVRAPRSGCQTTGEALAEAIGSSDARVIGDEVVGGRPVRRIAFGNPATSISGTYTVDPDTLLPVRLTVSLPEQKSVTGEIVGPAREVTQDFLAFEYLPPTPENIKLVTG
jgi:hypothetical protein